MRCSQNGFRSRRRPILLRVGAVRASHLTSAGIKCVGFIGCGHHTCPARASQVLVLFGAGIAPDQRGHQMYWFDWVRASPPSAGCPRGHQKYWYLPVRACHPVWQYNNIYASGGRGRGPEEPGCSQHCTPASLSNGVPYQRERTKNRNLRFLAFKIETVTGKQPGKANSVMPTRSAALMASVKLPT